MISVYRMKLRFYVPEGYRIEDNKIENLLEDVKKSLNINYERITIDEQQQRDLKEKFLLSISVSKGVKIHQSKKSKSLYPQLVVFDDEKAITFYNQERAKEKITIQEFLSGLLNGEVKCLHEKYEIENALQKSIKSGNL